MDIDEKNKLASILDEKHSITFINDGVRHFIGWSDCNEGWMMELYKVSDEIESRFDKELVESLGDEYDAMVDSIDGGLCTGEAMDAIEFFECWTPSTLPDDEPSMS